LPTDAAMNRFLRVAAGTGITPIATPDGAGVARCKEEAIMKKIVVFACAVVAAFSVVVPAAGARSRQTHSAHASAAASGLDKEYLKSSMQGDLFEIIGGKFALKHSHNAAVIRLAKRLVTDHSKSYSDAVKLARKLGVDVEKTPSPSETWELQIVSRLHGRTYNRWYSSLEVYDHVQDIEETTDEIKDGSNKDVINDARTNLPVLRLHLKLARQAFRASK
jgi:predicted outer membrane protein